MGRELARICVRNRLDDRGENMTDIKHEYILLLSLNKLATDVLTAFS